MNQQIYCAGVLMTVSVSHKWHSRYHLVTWPFGGETRVGVDVQYRGSVVCNNAMVALAAAEGAETISRRTKFYRYLLSYITRDGSEYNGWKWALQREGLLDDPDADFSDPRIALHYKPIVERLHARFNCAEAAK